MKSLDIYISEKFRVSKEMIDEIKHKFIPKTFDELREIIEQRYKEQGAGTEKNPIDFNDIDVSGMTSFYDEKEENGLFQNTDFEYINVSDWDVSNIKNMSNLFSYCWEIKELNLSNWDVSNVEDMNHMFNSCVDLQKLNISNWNVSKVKDMSQLFSSCFDIKELDLSNWDVSNVEDMSNMFWSCESLKLLDLSNWDVSKVKDMSGMFYSCKSLEKLDISDWNTSNIMHPETVLMFKRCKKEIIPDWYKE